MKKLSKLLLSAAIVSAAAAMTAISASAVAPADGVTPGKTGPKDEPAPLVTLQDIPTKVTRKGPSNPFVQAAPAQGEGYSSIPLVIITIGFNDMPYSDDYDWGSTIFQGDTSLRQYYLDQSFGKFTFDPVTETCAYGVDGNTNTHDAVNDGVIHVTVDRNHEDWAGDDHQDSLMEVFHEAVTKSMAYIDYSVYDTNGNGLVENNELAVSFVVAGYEAAASEDYAMGIEKYLWAHAAPYAEYYHYFFDEYPWYGDVTLNHYITISETVIQDDDLDNPEQASIAVLAHELGHYLGLPDLYDVNYTTGGEWEGYDVYRLSVMASGNWGTDPDTGKTTPYSFDPWCKARLGWVTPELIDESGVYDITGVDETNYASGMDVWLYPVSDSEYYLIENRRYAGWDAGLAGEAVAIDGEYYYATAFNPTGGLVFWHIDNDIIDAYGNELNVSTHRPGIMPLFFELGDSGLSMIDSNVTGINMFSKDLTDMLTDNETIAFPLWTYGGSDSRADRMYTGATFTVLTPGQETMQMYFLCGRNNVEEATGVGSSLTMDGSIGMNLYLFLPLEVAEDDGAYLKFEGPNGTVTIPVSEAAVPNQDVYRFTYYVYPRQIFDTITVGLYDYSDDPIAVYDTADNVLFSAATPFTTSVSTYIQQILDDTDNYPDDLVTLAEKLRNYGIYAARYIKNMLPDTDISSVPDDPTALSVAAADLDDYAVVEGAEVPGDVEIVGYSVVMHSTTDLRVYFRTADVDALTVAKAVETDTGVVMEPVSVVCLRAPEGGKKGSYYIDIKEYPSYMLLTPVTVSITDGTDTMDITVSPMSYVKLVYDHYNADDSIEKASLCNAMYAMYEYAMAADAYFA